MKKIAVVICNYNKKEYLLKCVKSVFEQDCSKEIDVYVVDNASSDGSADAVNEAYADRLTLIVNQENTGGSGGYNAGIKEALKKEYEYVVLADNDILMDKSAIRNLYLYLNAHLDTAIAGSLIYKMDESNIVMAYGSVLDPDKYEYMDCYRDYIGDDKLPEVKECDYVPACTMMVRRSVIDEIGLMDERNFLYWDDIDWATRMRNAGYKVVALKKSKVWHKGGGIEAKNTAPIYYFFRNNIKYYSTYLPDHELDTYVNALLKSIFLRLSGCYPKGRYNFAATVIRAYEDGLHGVMGKASDECILPNDEDNQFFNSIENNDKALFVLNENIKDEKYGYGVINGFVGYLSKRWPDKKFYISCFKCIKDIDEIKSNVALPQNFSINADMGVDCHMLQAELVKDIREVKNYQNGERFVDIRNNSIFCDQDYYYFSAFEKQFSFFLATHKKYFLDSIKTLRSKKAN